MKKTLMPCGAEVTTEIMKEQGVLIGVDFTIYDEGFRPAASFFIAGGTLEDALDLFKETVKDFKEETAKCSS